MDLEALDAQLVHLPAVVERVLDGEAARVGDRDDRGTAVRVADVHRVNQGDLGPRRRLLDDLRLGQGVDERVAAAVPAGDLGPLDLDLEVVDPQPGEGGQEVLDGVDLGALVAETRPSGHGC
jgi:hypothetical protein